MQACLADETLEGLLAERLTEPETFTVRKHVENCERCRGRLDQLSDHPQLRRWRVEIGGCHGCDSRGTQSPQDPRLVHLLAALRETPLLESSSVEANGDPNDGGLGFLGPPTQAGDLGMLGPYRVLAEIGRGGMGIVFKAHDGALDRTVAVKVLRPCRSDSRARTRFVREAQAAAGIQHENVVPVYSVASPSDGPPYLAMQFVAGPTLRQHLQQEGSLPPQKAARLTLQVADGLTAAHERGLIHRDIKPANIILDLAPLTLPSPTPPGGEGRARGGRAKILDFGLVRAREASGATTQEGTLAGTPEYMSPEQIRTPHQVDERTDVYSLGAVLYETLTGAAPFRGLPHLVLHQVLHDEPLPPRRLNDQVPRDLETICLKALAKEPARRYPTAAAFRDDLRRWLERQPIQARPASALERGRLWCRRKPLAAGLLAALLFVFGGGAAGITWEWLQAEKHRRQAETDRDLAQRKRAEAERGFRRAREAVDKYLTEVTENRDLKAHHFEPLRRELLQTAKQFYERFVEENPDNPDLRAELGKAHGRLGTITRILESPAQALAPFQRSVAIFERLHEEYPESLSYLHDLAFFQLQRGSCHAAIFQIEEAETAYLSAQALWEQLITAEPENDANYQFARSFTALADLYTEAKRMTEAERLYLDARGVLARLASEHPAETKFQAGLALNQTNLGRLHIRTG